MKALKLLPLLLALCSSAPASVLNYVESVSGDLSDNGNAPTLLDFDVGQNHILGTMGGPPNANPDFFTFTIDEGQALTSIFIHSMSPAERSFFAISRGTSIVTDSSATHLGSYLTYAQGELIEILAFGGNFGGTGFTAPLGPGQYTAWFQELTAPVSYDISFTVIPEPGTTAAILGVAVLGAVVVRRRRAQRLG